GPSKTAALFIRCPGVPKSRSPGVPESRSPGVPESVPFEATRSREPRSHMKSSLPQPAGGGQGHFGPTSKNNARGAAACLRGGAITSFPATTCHLIHPCKKICGGSLLPLGEGCAYSLARVHEGKTTGCPHSYRGSAFLVDWSHHADHL